MVSGTIGVGGRPAHRHVVLVGTQGKEHVATHPSQVTAVYYVAGVQNKP